MWYGTYDIFYGLTVGVCMFVCILWKTTECHLAPLSFSVIFVVADDTDIAVKTVADMYHVCIAGTVLVL